MNVRIMNFEIMKLYSLLPFPTSWTTKFKHSQQLFLQWCRTTVHAH